MTEQQETPKLSLADVFGKVELTAGDANLLLDGLSAMYSDKSPSLHQAFQKAMSDLNTPQETTTEPEQTTSY